MMSYLKNLCPHCNQAPLFTGIYTMNAVCPVCGVVFEKESGYFIGAMIASYFIGTFLALPVLLALVFLYDIEMPIALTVIMVQILLMQPLIFRFSRILWIRIEAKLTQAILNQNH